eukprot:897137-Pelagomonas_calceolata.AAC.1
MQCHTHALRSIDSQVLQELVVCLAPALHLCSFKPMRSIDSQALQELVWALQAQDFNSMLCAPLTPKCCKSYFGPSASCSQS